jgi:hypothetical protein
MVDGGDPGAIGLVALALAALGTVTFGWGSYLALAGAAVLALVVARAAQKEHQKEQLPFRHEDDWRIDPPTRQAARRGLRDARAALDRCRRRQLDRQQGRRGGPR